MPPRSRAEMALLDPTSLRVVVGFRVLSLAWMGLLVGFTLADPQEANKTIVVVTMIIAVVWTGLTAWLARTPHVLASYPFVSADVIFALYVGAASNLAGAEDLFHGGMVMSSIVVAAFAGGMRLAVGVSVIFTIEQTLVQISAGRGSVAAAGSVIFLVFALAAGWAFDSWRSRWVAERRLQETLTHQARQEERAALADQLHNSALQTFNAIRAAADDPTQVRYLARRQARELRSTIEDFRSPYENSFKVALLGLRDEIEDIHPVTIEAVVRHDRERDEVADVILKATRELLTNAAKHSGVSDIDLYADLNENLEIVVRDRGLGFDTTTRSDGLQHTVYDPISRVGGEVIVESVPGQGTEAFIRVPRNA